MSKLLDIPPVALTTSAANLLNCALGSLAGPVGMTATQPFLRVTRITAVNETSSDHTATLYKGASGASAAGTAFAFKGTKVPANSSIDKYMDARFEAADFLTGLADANTAITINIDAELEFS